MAAADWSLLPSDLVNRIADCFLATNDVDYYMDLRAVCSNWRSATDDPKHNPDHPRFRPRQWIVLDDDISGMEDTTGLLVNTSTGRLLCKELPLLFNYYLVATTLGGFFVMADGYGYPYASRVLNPFTGHMIRFMATMPSDIVDAAAVIGSPPTLVLLCDSQHKWYVADPDSKCLVAYEDEHAYPLIRLAVVGGMYADGEQRPVPPLPVAAAADEIFDLMRLFSVDPSQMFTDDVVQHFSVDDAPEMGRRCFLVQSAGEVFIIIKLQQQQRMEVFKMDTGRAVLEPVKNIGGRAIFIGYRRCLAVDADEFPSIEANCIYHIKGMNPYDDVYMYDIYKYGVEDEKEEMITEAICWSDPFHIIRDGADPRFTPLHLLSSYTINIQGSQLASVRVCLEWINGY